MTIKLLLAFVATFGFSGMLSADFWSSIPKTDESEFFQLENKGHRNLRRGPRGHRGDRGPRGYRGHRGKGGVDPSFVASQILNVNKGGNDTTGDGSDEKPFLTVMHACPLLRMPLPPKGISFQWVQVFTMR